jgi:hypothetical protein
MIVAAGAAGCGGSSSSTSSSAPWTRARANAFAAAVNLTAADVPGFTPSPQRETAADRQNVAQLASCAGAVDPSRRIVDVRSDDFSRGSGLQVQQVNSSVDVLPSATLAKQDFTRFTAASARGCIATYAAHALATATATTSSSVKFGTPSIRALTPLGGTGTNSFGYRFVIPLRAAGATINVYIDLLFHRAGPAEVAFNDSAIGTPFPPADQQRLFSLLVTRADAHSK